MKSKILFLLTLFILIFQLPASAAFKKDEPVSAVDADGNAVGLYVTGDEYVRVLHDGDGYVMVMTEDGYAEYAKMDSGVLVPCEGNKTLKYEDIPEEYFKREREKTFACLEADGAIIPGKDMELFGADDDVKEFKGKGTVVVVPIAFSGGSSNMAGVTDTVEHACEYFRQVSYGQLDLGFYDASEGGKIYVSSKTENYFSPYSSSNRTGYSGDTARSRRENELVKAALDFYGLKNDRIDEPIDVDGDGANDFLVFVYNLSRETEWNSLLWPHQMTYSSVKYNILGKGVKSWIFVPIGNGEEVLCHEMYHSIGAYDLYDYNQRYNYVGMWDIMEVGNGTMLAYMKYRYGGWIPEIPEITEAGTYTINPACESENNCYKIPINKNEYYVLEYRNRFSGQVNYLDNWRQWHNEGLLITRVDSRYSGDGNMYGNNTKNEINLVKHPALGVNSILGAVLPEFSPESGFDRSLQSGGVDNSTVIKNIRENADGTLSFDVSFDGETTVGLGDVSGVEIVPGLVRNGSTGQLYCRLTVKNSSDGTVNADYGIEYMYFEENETSANSYEYKKYTGYFPINKQGILWAYLTDSTGMRVGAPYYVYVYPSDIKQINTAKNVNSAVYDVPGIYNNPTKRFKYISFTDGEQYVGKLHMDRIIRFNVDGTEYEYASEDLRGRMLNFDASVVEISAGYGSEAYMSGAMFEDYNEERTVVIDSMSGRRSLFEFAETIMPGDKISLEIPGNYPGEIRYTTDGTHPTKDAPVYTEPFEVTEDTFVKTVYYENGQGITYREFMVYVNEDYRTYSTDELNKIFKNSGSAISGGDGRYIKLTLTPGEGGIVITNEAFMTVAKVENPDKTEVLYIPVEEDVFIRDAWGDCISLTALEDSYPVDLTVLEDGIAVHNFGMSDSFELVTAGYEGERMTDADVQQIFVDSGKTEYIDFPIGMENMRVFGLRSLAKVEPVCRAVSK